MNLAAVASQLREAKASDAGATLQAAAAASSVAGAWQAGKDRARGALQTIAGEAQAKANLLGIGGSSSSTTGNAIAHDGVRCEGCGERFGFLRRRQTCGSCDRYLCGVCLGSSAAVAGISCFCASVCPQCRELGERNGEFQRIKAKMEEGVNVSIGLPRKAGLFGGGSEKRNIVSWFSLQSSTGCLVWGSLEQKGGRPAEEGKMNVSDVLHVRNTGLMLELAVKGQNVPTTLEFGSAEEREAWTKYLELAVEILTPESERADQEAARASHRSKELEERRALNEERKKQLSTGLGMRFTAEAMINRSSGQ